MACIQCYKGVYATTGGASCAGCSAGKYLIPSGTATAGTTDSTACTAVSLPEDVHGV